ncbi:MAG: NUDIX domain-containing protein, partial [Patescibacteria group bacterium]|nr:NUDIX domain-containing protein [Patescibacteria group bacterium]MDE1944242.1 NUDIX domain-containing protein [Patescibacteria group bacterium]MDE1945322.1 NUDIX domain-containing protein [Patescibacteria group bacterium]MDE2058104.1 NUDIX domain-containing protein [Patescibacteria group bacterium]
MIEPKEKELHRIAVTGIIWKEEGGARTYLITKRAPHKKAWPGKWTVPGGGMQVDDYINEEKTFANEESPQWYNAVEKTLRREIREEVGLEVSDIGYLLDVAFIRPDGIPAIVLSFYCQYASGEVALDEDATEYAWITAAEVGDYELIQGIDHEITLVEERLAGRP